MQAEEVCNEYMEKMAEEGIEVFTFTEEELAAFAESSRNNVWPQLEANYPDGWLQQGQDSLAA